MDPEPRPGCPGAASPHDTAMLLGNLRVAEALLPLVYEEVRHLAEPRLTQELPGQSFNSSAWCTMAWPNTTRAGKCSFPSTIIKRGWRFPFRRLESPPRALAVARVHRWAGGPKTVISANTD